MAITAGVRPGSKLWDNMLKREVTDLDDFYERAQKYIRVEDGHENLKAGKVNPISSPWPMKAQMVQRRKECMKGQETTTRESTYEEVNPGKRHTPSSQT